MTSKSYFDDEWHEIRRLFEFYVLLAIFITCGLLMVRHLSGLRRNLPPGPGGLPMVGYLPFLGKEPFRALDRLTKTYGNVISLYLGQTHIVILGDFPAVKEAFSLNTTTDRPPRLFDFLPDGVGISCVSGEEWMEQRRFVVRSMKNIGLGTSTWVHLVEEEVSDFIGIISSKNGEPIDMGNFLTPSVSNNILSLVFGKRIPPGPDRDLLNSFLDTFTTFFSPSSLWNSFPWLCSLLARLKFTSYHKIFCEMLAFNSYIRKEIDAHRNFQNDLNVNDFIMEYLRAMKSCKDMGKTTTFNERNMVGNTQALYIAGSNTTRVALTWLYLAMAAYPDVQKKVHSELDSVLGRNQRASWDDRPKFPYIYAVIMESLRWKTNQPLNMSRVASEDISLCGYAIPKGTRIIANNWGLHNDPRYWKQPEEFIPERFLSRDGKEVFYKPDSYVPFSYGKRKCPGEKLAMMEIFLYFTALMQLFEVRVPNGGKPKLNGVLAITYKPVSQELCFFERYLISEDV